MICFNQIRAQGNCRNVPPGYEAVSLIEALNGPSINRVGGPAVVLGQELVDPDDTAAAVQAVEVLNR